MTAAVFAEFESQTQGGQLEVRRDRAPDRHLRFIPENPAFRFEILTWPHHLLIISRHGTYVFDGPEDMFGLFRSPPGPEKDDIAWAQQLLSKDHHGDCQEFDGEAFWSACLEQYHHWVGDKDPHEDVCEKVSEALHEQIRPYCEPGFETECLARQAAAEFCSHGLKLSALPSCRRYIPGFLWCCYAIPWAIAQYDEEKEGKRGQLAENSPVDYLPDLSTFD